MRAITYARVSTADQADSGAGLDAQADAMNAEVERRGWELVANLVDEGKSGSNLDRPALTQALAMLAAGEADTLIVAKLDRLSRTVRDFTSITDVAQRQGWAVVALDVGVDMTTPTGELMANISSSVAQWERRIIAARTRDALAARKARGQRLGRPVSLCDETRHRIATRTAEGASLRTVAGELNADEVPTARGGTWHASTVHHVLASLALDAEAEALSAA